MTSIVKFTPLSGAHDEKPLCYLLEIDEFKLLLDCGWDDHLNLADLKLLKGVAPHVDAVLLTHPDLPHLGALPYAMARMGLDCKVYCTNPVKKMGKMFMYDTYQSRQDQEDFDLFTPDDIDAAFDNIVDLKYAEERELTDRSGGYTGIKVEPQQAGHMIGGTIWKITKDSEEIIYAVDYNHGRERHLDHSALDLIRRPRLLITNALNSKSKRPKRKDLDKTLEDVILKVLRNHGNIMVATDTAGRVLELLLLLEQKLSAKQGANAYNLLVLNHVGPTVMEFASTMIEFMSKKGVKDGFEKKEINPFDYDAGTGSGKLFRICHSMEQLEAMRGPKVVLTSQSGFESGYGRALFLKWSKDPRNFIYFTGKPAVGTLGRRLVDEKRLKKLELLHKRRERLQGAELAAFTAKKLKVAAAEKRRLELVAQEEAMGDDDEADGMGDSDDDDDSNTLLQHDLMAPATKTAGMDTFKQAKTFDMFPCVDDKLQWDDYGEKINPADYVIEDMAMTSLRATETAPMQLDEPAMLEQPPTKCVASVVQVDILCTIAFSDFSGLSDGEATMRTLKAIQPRSLILVHGSADETEHLEERCAESEDMTLESIFAPKPGECINVTSDLNIYQVKLTDALFSHQFGAGPNQALHFSSVDTHGEIFELAWINGVIDYGLGGMAAAATQPVPMAGAVGAVPMLEGGQEPAKPAGDEGDEDEVMEDPDAAPLGVMPSLNALHTASHKDHDGHKAVFIGDLRLTDFKSVLARAGISAVFSGGMLVCNDVVAVKKFGSSGRLALEGNVCETYYAVRELLYGQFAVV